MIHTLLTGATGTLGTPLRERLVTAGHTVRAASRSPPDEAEENIDWVELDLTKPTDLETALEGVDLVVHTATAPQGDTEAVDVEGTKRLLDAADAAGVEHLIYPSIVGVDDIPLSYYQQKAAAETAVEESAVPTTVVRATQFYSFVAGLLDSVAKLPVWPLPTKMQLQPVTAEEVADTIVGHATLTASGRTDPVGGPEIHTVGELARAYRAVRGRRRPIIRVPIPGETMTGFRSGYATCPDFRQGALGWEEWLTARYASETAGPPSRVRSPT